MGLFEQTAKVKMTYVVDTTQARAEIKGLSGVQREAARKQLADIEATNKKIKEQAEGMKDTADKLGLIGAATAAATMLAVKSLEAFGKANAENAKQVARVTGAWNKGVNELLVGLGAVVMRFGPMIQAAGEFLGVIGKIVDKLEQADNAAGFLSMGGAMGRAKREANKAAKRTGMKFGGGPLSFDAPGAISGSIKSLIAAARAAMGGDVWAAGEIEMPEMDMRSSPKKAGAPKSFSNKTDVSAMIAQIEAELAQAEADRTSGMIRSSVFGEDEIGGRVGASKERAAIDIALSQFNGTVGELQKRIDETYTDFKGAQSKSFLEAIFGPVEEFDNYRMQMELLQGTVGNLTNALSAGFGAWIDGSESVSAAIKRALAESLKASAMQMFAESVKHGAMALGSLAFQDYRGAAQHGKAAAVALAGAALVGSLAKGAYSAGWAGGGGGRASAPSVSAPSGAGGSGPSGAIIVYGDTHAEDTARGRQERAKRMVSKAIGNSTTKEW
jgi:hypothetical protein